MGKMGPMSRMRNGNNNRKNTNNPNPTPKDSEVKENTVNTSQVDNIKENEVKACSMPQDMPPTPKNTNSKYGAYSALVSSHDRVRKNANKKTAKMTNKDIDAAKISTQKIPVTKKEQRPTVKKANEEFNCKNLKEQAQVQKREKAKEIDVRDKKRLEEIIMEGISEKYKENGNFNIFDDLNEDNLMKRIDGISKGRNFEFNKDELMDMVNKKLDKEKIMDKIKITTEDMKHALDDQSKDIHEPDIDDKTEPDIDDNHEPNVKETVIEEDTLDADEKN